MTTCRDAFLSCLGGIQFKNPKCRHLLLDAAYTAFHNGGDSLTVTQMASTDRGTIGRGNAPLLVAGPQGRSKEMPPRPYHFVLNRLLDGLHWGGGSLTGTSYKQGQKQAERERRKALHLESEWHPLFHPHGVQLWNRQGCVSGKVLLKPAHLPHLCILHPCSPSQHPQDMHFRG